MLLLHPRWQRVAVMGAGTFISFLALVPCAVLWWEAPRSSMLGEFSAVVLIVLNLAAFTNLLPFLELDGYVMLSHALTMMDLRKQAQQFWRGWCKRVVLRQQAPLPQGYDRRSQQISLVYGICSEVFTVLFLASSAFFWWVTLVRLLLKGIVTWNLVPALALVLLHIVLRSKKIRAWVHRVRDAMRTSI